MANGSPVLYVIAGPNGSGKSTFADSLDLCVPIFDFDAIARRRNATSDAELILAGRKFLADFQTQIAKHESAVLETTLTGRTIINRLTQARNSGFRVEMHYLFLASIALGKKRIEQRVCQGGHDINDEVQERRFPRSRNNLLPAALLADETVIWDNSYEVPQPLIRLIPDTPTAPRVDLPDWLLEIVNAYHKMRTPE